MELNVEKGDWLILKKTIKVSGNVFDKGLYAEVVDIEDFIPKLKIVKDNIEHFVYCIRADLFEKLTKEDIVELHEDIEHNFVMKKNMILENVNEIYINHKTVKPGKKFLVMSNEDYPLIMMENDTQGMFLQTRVQCKDDFKVIHNSMENELQKWTISDISFYNKDSFFTAGYEITLEKDGEVLKIKSEGFPKKEITLLSDKEVVSHFLSDVKKILCKNINDKEIIEYFAEYVGLRNYAFKTFNKFLDEKLKSEPKEKSSLQIK